MAIECKLRKSVSVEAQKQWKKMEVVKQEDQIFLKHKGKFYGYCHCCQCNNFGHMDREFELKKSVSVESQKQWKKMEVVKQEDKRFFKDKGKLYGYFHFCHKFGYKDTTCRTKGKY